jgi:hypothetical protein
MKLLSCRKIPKAFRHISGLHRFRKSVTLFVLPAVSSLLTRYRWFLLQFNILYWKVAAWRA